MATVPNKSRFVFDKQPRLIYGAFRLILNSTWFLQKYHRILLPEHWSEMEAKWAIREAIEHYEEFKRAPKFQTMRMRLDADTKLKPEEEELVGRFLAKLEGVELDDATVEYIDTNFEAFVRYRATLHALREAHEYLQDGDEDAAVEVVQESERIRLIKDDWHLLPEHADSYFKYFSEENIARVSVTTGIEPIDKVLKGGLRNGELGVIVAGYGVGKSMALVHLGAAAYRKGLTVAHFTFENSWEETQARYMHNLLDINSDALAKMDADDPLYVERADRMDSFGGSIAIIELPGSDTAPIDIENYIRRLDEQEKSPDIILVDYADLMRSGRRSARRADRWQELGSIYEELRQVAANMDIPLWTASQANRDGSKANAVRGYHVGGALGKLNVADVALTISRETRDVDKAIQTDTLDEDMEIDSEYRIWRVIKLRRGGSDGWMLRLFANYGKARFEVVDEIADINAAIDGALESGTSLRKNDATD